MPACNPPPATLNAAGGTLATNTPAQNGAASSPKPPKRHARRRATAPDSLSELPLSLRLTLEQEAAVEAEAKASRCDRSTAARNLIDRGRAIEVKQVQIGPTVEAERLLEALAQVELKAKAFSRRLYGFSERYWREKDRKRRTSRLEAVLAQAEALALEAIELQEHIANLASLTGEETVVLVDLRRKLERLAASSKTPKEQAWAQALLTCLGRFGFLPEEADIPASFQK